jgi:signal peptidase I
MSARLDHTYWQAASELLQGRDGLLRLKVSGSSMAPLLQAGDVVQIEAVQPEYLALGDLVVVRRQRDFVTHRLVSKSPPTWVTKGDNCAYLDPPFEIPALVGRVVVIEGRRSRVDLRTQKWHNANRWLANLARLEARWLQFIQPSQRPSNLLARAFVRLSLLPFRLLIKFIVNKT